MWAYYESASGYGTSSPAATTIITAVAAAFGGVSGAGGESGAIFDGVNSGYGAFGFGGNQGDDVPAAYLNYILFDKNYKLLDMGWQAVTSAGSRTVILYQPVPIKRRATKVVKVYGKWRL